MANEKASEMKQFKVTYQTPKGSTSVNIKARDEKEAKAKVRSRPNYKGNPSASLVKEAKLTEGVLDDMDDDGFMAKRQLYDLAKYSVELHRMIQDTDNLEPWIQAKITKAADYIDTVKHYMEYKDVDNAADMADEVGFDDLAGVVDTMGPEEPQEEVMEFGQEDEQGTVEPEDILRMAVTRGIISPVVYNSALGGGDGGMDAGDWWKAAEDTSYDIGPVDEIGSSDVSIWMRTFVSNAKYHDLELDGQKAHLYESQIKAQSIYKKMLGGLRGKK